MGVQKSEARAGFAAAGLVVAYRDEGQEVRRHGALPSRGKRCRRGRVWESVGESAACRLPRSLAGLVLGLLCLVPLLKSGRAQGEGGPQGQHLGQTTAAGPAGRGQPRQGGWASASRWQCR